YAVANASQEFDRYLYKVHAFKSDAKRAETGQSRYDAHNFSSQPPRQTNAEVEQSVPQRPQSYYNSSLGQRASTPTPSSYQTGPYGQQRPLSAYYQTSPIHTHQQQQQYPSYGNEGFQHRHQQQPQQQPFLAPQQQQMNMYPSTQFTSGQQYQQPGSLPQSMDHTQMQPQQQPQPLQQPQQQSQQQPQQQQQQ
ncbi:MAG: hypothetical protein Q9165_003207, partial [Trypethelium subeluteriae]